MSIGRILPILLALGTPLAAQQTVEAGDEPPVCYGFTFGRWSPALDPPAAGHDPRGTPASLAPNGRSWAMNDSTSATLMLFPAWWPAGVSVRLGGPPPAIGDTATGSATALVADGRRRPPAARITVTGIPCSAPRQ